MLLQLAFSLLPVFIFMPEMPSEEKHKNADNHKENEHICIVPVYIPGTDRFIQKKDRHP